MKRVIILICSGLLLQSVGQVQAQDPLNFHIIYGNRDGSPMNVQLGSIIEVPVWGATDPTPGNGDTVTFMQNPLASSIRIIPERYGGSCAICMYCCQFIDPDFCDFDSSYACQSMLWFGYLQDPPPGIFFWTGGDTVQIGSFIMRVTDDSSYLGQTVCPFSMGHDPANAGLLWGIIGGSRSVVPAQTYSCLHFPRCIFIPGDANSDSVYNGLDIAYCIGYLRGRGSPPTESCNCPGHGMVYDAADANGSCQFNGLDITFGVRYLRGNGPAPRGCPSCD
jgi:hypothetical protein